MFLELKVSQLCANIAEECLKPARKSFYTNVKGKLFHVQRVIFCSTCVI